ncbi:MAG: two-component regulator propeller domain-containing protein, partial [Balneolaceae bacterium]
MTESMEKQSYFIKFTATLFLLCFFAQLSAQAQSDAFRHITPRDGLPNGYIQTMTQDSKGFIWIGTDSGLGKHDGYSMTTYRNDSRDSSTISGEIIYDIIEYDETTFFLATDGGLNLFNPATEVFDLFTVPDSLPDPGIVQDLLLFDEHSMWIAAGSGLFHVDPTTLRDVNPNVEFFEIPGVGANQAANLTALATDSLNNLWVGSDSTLFKFDLEAKNFEDIGPVDDDIARILEGNIWSMLSTSGNHLIITSLTGGLAILKDADNGFEKVKQLGEYNIEELPPT